MTLHLKSEFVQITSCLSPTTIAGNGKASSTYWSALDKDLIASFTTKLMYFLNFNNEIKTIAAEMLDNISPIKNNVLSKNILTIVNINIVETKTKNKGVAVQILFFKKTPPNND